LREFLKANHIQGYVNSSKSIGLQYDNRLVAVMTFSSSRFDKSIEWELMRFCVETGVSVVGGASKLFKYFLDHNTGSIVSYADRSFSQGNLYNKLGFIFKENTKPGYKYLVNGNLESRLKFQKHKLKNILPKFNELLTERENMNLNGFYRIYDAGHQKWLYERMNK